MKKNTGTGYQKLFKDIIQCLGKKAYLYRIADAAEVKAVTGVTGFQRKQPSDFILTINGRNIYAEIKSSSDPTRFYFSALETGQHTAAKQIVSAGGLYYIFIYSIVMKNWYVVSYENIKEKTSSLKWVDMEIWIPSQT